VYCRNLKLLPGGSYGPARVANRDDVITRIKVSIDFNLGVNRLG